MGKKRRAIHRSRKFTSKYYSWLDSVDRTGVIEASPSDRSDNILEGTKPYVHSVTVTDKGNQLIEVTAIHRGDCDKDTDKITVHVDGVEVFQTDDANGITFAEGEKASHARAPDGGVSGDLAVKDDGSGKDKFHSTAGTKLTDKSGVQFIMKPGKHKLTVKYHDGGGSGVGVSRVKDSKTVSFTVKQHAITLSASPFTDAGDGQVNFNRQLLASDEAAAISGYRNRGDLNNAKMDNKGGNATNGWTITVTRDVNGVATTVPVSAAASTASNAAKDAHATAIDILAGAADPSWYDAGDKLKLQVTLTPRDSGDRDADNDGKGRDLTESAKTFEVELTKP